MSTGGQGDAPRPHVPGQDERFDFENRPRRRRRRDPDRPERKKGLSIASLVVISLILTLVIIAGPIVYILSMVVKVREAASRAQEARNLQVVVLAVGSYCDAGKSFPEARGQLSWRVEILNHLEQGSLKRRIDFRQPWDAPENRGFAAVRIPVYASPDEPPTETKSPYCVFIGPGTLYEPGQPVRRFDEVPDGLANTVFAVEATETVPWPAPHELAVVDGALPDLGRSSRNVFFAAALDGSVKRVLKTTPHEQIRALISPADGDAVPADW